MASFDRPGPYRDHDDDCDHHEREEQAATEIPPSRPAGLLPAAR